MPVDSSSNRPESWISFDMFQLGKMDETEKAGQRRKKMNILPHMNLALLPWVNTCCVDF